MQRVTLLTGLVLIASAGCMGGVSLGGATSGGNDGGADGTQPPESDGASPDASFASDASDARSSIDAAEESPPKKNPPPNGCGGVCSGMTMPSTQVTSIATLHGSWSMCGGQLPIMAPNYGGLPADTMGLEIDAATGTAYVLVSGDGGVLTRGVGPQYVWSATLDYPGASVDPSITDLNLTNNSSNSWLVLTVTYFPAADGCTVAMHLVNNSSGENGEQSDFVLTSTTPLCTQCGPVCVYPECGGCGTVPPASATRSVSLSLTGVSFDGASASGWQTLGFNLDGKCTTTTSSEVCTLAPGSNPNVQTDGTGGIDNGFGENFCPILETLSNASACSSGISSVYVVTDASGSGTMAVPVGNSWLEFPIHDAFVAQNGSPTGSGILGAVTPTAGFLAAIQAIAGQFPGGSLCAPQYFGTIASQIEQTADILSTGADDPGAPCDAISIGMTFTRSAPFGGPFPAVSSGCVADAGYD